MIMENGNKDKLRESIEAWVAEDGLELVDRTTGNFRIRVPLSEDRAISVGLLPLNGGVIFMVFLDHEASPKTLTETALFLCAVNSEMPYGVFELDLRDGVVSIRDYVYAVDDDVSPDLMRFALGSVMYTLERYESIIRAVTEGIVDHKIALDKLEERRRDQFDDEGEQSGS